MLESRIEYTVVMRAMRAGWFVRKVAWLGRKDAPDRVFAKGGRTVWIEFKAPGEVARLSQDKEHGLMRAAGMEVHVVDSVIAGLRILGLTNLMVTGR
jgi:hypothetical protein